MHALVSMNLHSPASAKIHLPQPHHPQPDRADYGIQPCQPSGHLFSSFVVPCIIFISTLASPAFPSSIQDHLVRPNFIPHIMFPRESNRRQLLFVALALMVFLSLFLLQKQHDLVLQSKSPGFITEAGTKHIKEKSEDTPSPNAPLQTKLPDASLAALQNETLGVRRRSVKFELPSLY